MGCAPCEEYLFEMNSLRKAFLLSVCLAIVTVTASVTFHSAQAQNPAVTAGVRPFEPTEELYYEAEFSRSLLRKLDVADFTFRASRTFLTKEAHPANDTSTTSPYALTFSAEVASKGFFTRLFNLNFHERVESTVEPITFTVQRTTIHDQQGKRVRTSEATFDSDKGRVSWTQRDPNNPSREPRNVVTDFTGQLQDVLSAIYFIRMQKLEVGKSFEISITDGGRIYNVPVKVVEKKRMKSLFGKINTYRVDPDVFGPDRLIHNEKGELNIWLSDDHHRVPVACRIKTEYGTFDIKLKRVVYNPAI